MREIFTSQRLETVEGVAKLLNAHDIATLIRNGRSYNTGYARRFSYRDGAGKNPPAVWVIHPDDLPRARQLLREAGLLPEGQQHGSFVPASYGLAENAPAGGKQGFTPARLRMVLLIGIGAVLAMTAWWQSRQKPAMHIASPARPALPPARIETLVHTVETPPALAQTLHMQLLRQHGLDHACLLRDGKAVADACNEGADFIDIHHYRTDGSGEGEVSARWLLAGQEGQARYQVRREGYDWQVMPAKP